MIYYLVTEKHHYTVSQYLRQSWGSGFRGRLVVVPYERVRELKALRGASYIFSDLDRLTDRERSAAARMHNRLRDGGLARHLLNDPARFMGRLKLLNHLHESGANTFRALRATGVDAAGRLRFPVFMREEIEHTGTLTNLIWDQDGLDKVLRKLRGRGIALEKLLVVEFCDTSGGSNRFRKYSAFNVGGEIIPRYLTTSEEWMVKYASMIVTEETVAREIEYMETNPHREWLAEVFRTAGVDYGRIDYGMLDGRPQVWEINVNPTIGAPLRRKPPTPKRQREVAMRLPFTTEFYRRFNAALERLDCGSAPG